VNVLVIGPHPDDEAIGCGGKISLHVARGDRVLAVFLTSGELGLKRRPRDQAWRQRETEAQAAAGVLGIADLTFLRRSDWFVSECMENTAMALRPILYRESPGLIYLPHSGEWHPDHKASLSVVRIAPILRCYEFWTPLGSTITWRTSRKRWRASGAIRCYRSQLAQYATIWQCAGSTSTAA
jgi:LmbE family N-acetylglucosaminyl deacetylase